MQAQTIEDMQKEVNRKLNKVMSDSALDEGVKDMALVMIMSVLDNVNKLSVAANKPYL